jgi:hypothetical protein
VSGWSITPVEKDLTRLYDPLSGWTKLALVERHNQPDTWTIEGSASVLSVFTAGSGCILDRDGVQITSGYVRSVGRSGTQAEGSVVESMTVGFVSHLSALYGRVIIPSPATPIGAAITTLPAAYDAQTGPAEDLILHYVQASLGDLTVADRRLQRLRIPASQHRGPVTTITARLNNLGELVASLAESGGLRVTIRHTEPGPWLDLVVESIADVSNDIRFGSTSSTAAGLVSEWDYSIEEPTVTRAIVAAAGELTDRRFLRLVDPDAEALWGRAVETVVDQRQTDSSAEMTSAAQEELAKGAGPVKVSFTPILSPDLQLRRDVRIGDVVGYDLPGLDPSKDTVRQATTTVSAEAGATETTEVVVGTPDAPQTRSQRQVVSAIRGVNAIQRSS